MEKDLTSPPYQRQKMKPSWISDLRSHAKEQMNLGYEGIADVLNDVADAIEVSLTTPQIPRPRQGECGHFKVRERFTRHLEMAVKAGPPPGYPEWRAAPEHLHQEINTILSEEKEDDKS